MQRLAHECSVGAGEAHHLHELDGVVRGVGVEGVGAAVAALHAKAQRGQRVDAAAALEEEAVVPVLVQCDFVERGSVVLFDGVDHRVGVAHADDGVGRDGDAVACAARADGPSDAVDELGLRGPGAKDGGEGVRRAGERAGGVGGAAPDSEHRGDAERRRNALRPAATSFGATHAL